MTGTHKARNMFDRATGKIKEVAGRSLNDPALEREGRAGQRASHLRDAGEKVKDAFRPRPRRPRY